MTGAGIPLVTGVDREARRALVLAEDRGVGGIDRVEVLSNLPGAEGHRPGPPARQTLLVWVTDQRLLDAVTAEQVHIRGGVRIDPLVNPVRVRWAIRADQLPGGTDAPDGSAGGDGPTPEDRLLVEDSVPAADRARVLVVRTSSSGDWSTYVLEITGVDDTATPRYDPPLATAPFAFTVDLASDLDDRVPPPARPPVVSPAVDYLARDYEGLRARLLDRFAALLPRWSGRGPADPVVMLAELFADLGDRLAVWQDAIAAEAYLGTARRRVSVARHARLLDYRIHEGSSARTWLSFTTPVEFTLPAGTPVADGPPSDAGPEPLPAVADAVRDGAIVFETCHDAVLRPENNEDNELWLHSWGDPEHVLPAGTTAAFVRHPPAKPPRWSRGDVLVLAAVGATGLAEDGNPALRHAVRLVADPVRSSDAVTGVEVLELRWSVADALPFPLAVTRRADDGTAELLAKAVGNVVLADHGATVPTEPLVPGRVPAMGAYRPRLARRDLAWVDPPPTTGPDAVATLVTDPRRAGAAVRLHDGTRQWEPRLDLLGGGPEAAAFVVESESDGSSSLRFGDGLAGRRPEPGSVLNATYRVGGGAEGNVAPGVLTTVLHPLYPGLDPTLLSRIAGVTVTNLLAAAAGTDPEPLATARSRASSAFRTQRRAVTEADYAVAAARHPAVSRAVARRRWTGAWHTVEVVTDLVADRAADRGVRDQIEAEVDAHRMAGVDVMIGDPITVPLEIALRVHLVPGYPRSAARRLLAAAFGPTGAGFFHPDRFTFGRSLLATELAVAAMAVPGVEDVEVGDDEAGDDDTGLRFRRLGVRPIGDDAGRRIAVGTREVIRADSDPSRPENGRVDIELVGGS